MKTHRRQIRIGLLGALLSLLVLAGSAWAIGDYTEWTYYDGPSHTTVVGGRTIIVPHGGWSWGERTQYCDIIVCSGGSCETESSNNCLS